MSLIEDLLQLDLVERQLRGLRSRVQSAQVYCRAQERQMQSLAERREELELRRKQRQVAINGHETDNLAIDERLNKLREDLNAASTTKQYSTVLEEINTLKQSKSATDDLILSEMTEVESVDAEVEQLAEEIAERDKVLTSARHDLTEREAEIADRVSELQTERDVKASSIPASALDTYDRCADDFDGDAMAAVQEIDRRRREYCCGSCNLNLPFNVVVTLMTSSDSITQCENCLRILYITPELKAETVAK